MGIALWATTQHFGAAQRTPVATPALPPGFYARHVAPALGGADGSFERLTLLQEAASDIAWVALAAAAAAWMERGWARVAAFVGVLAVWISRDVGGWNRVVGPESWALTTFALALAAALVAVRAAVGPPRALLRLGTAAVAVGTLGMAGAASVAWAWLLPGIAVAAALAAARYRPGRGSFGLLALGAGGWAVVLAFVALVGRVGEPDAGPGPAADSVADVIAAPLAGAIEAFGAHPCVAFPKRDVAWVVAVERVAWPTGLPLLGAWAGGLAAAAVVGRRPDRRVLVAVLVFLLVACVPLVWATWGGDPDGRLRRLLPSNLVSRLALWLLLLTALDRPRGRSGHAGPAV